MFELIRNERISADGWYQDVRHFEFRCQDDIAYVLFYFLEEGCSNCHSYDPGDVAVIHPEASPVDVDLFLTTLGWSNSADDPIRVQRVFEGLSACLCWRVLRSSTLRPKPSRSSSSSFHPPRPFFPLSGHQRYPQAVFLSASKAFRH